MHLDHDGELARSNARFAIGHYLGFVVKRAPTTWQVTDQTKTQEDPDYRDRTHRYVSSSSNYDSTADCNLAFLIYVCSSTVTCLPVYHEIMQLGSSYVATFQVHGK